ncbi:MAG: methylamine utilization protein MauE [Pseudomonadales bacterium]|nr:methylamine utilization protein MauE [Gammaproteobacteria bacterium]MBL6746453.1 methylamine utilization protein MauE [Pseudomonadales bacterium]MBL6817673.1 methylamine utilization protein MauE [Pseudomonadales bacterium]OUX33783.1 MAG: methylamine utilization protein MauE [Gammaproteobacteria bacterium TMED260]
MPETGPHWVSVRGRGVAYLLDADSGRVGGTLDISNFTPAVRPAMDRERIYAYGSFYTRGTYGDRTDVLIGFDTNTTLPVSEAEIPPKAAGIGNPGMIGLINDDFIGVWNVTPAISVSIVDLDSNEFVTEISTPNCAGIYPAGEGFISSCADGTIQYVEIDSNGEEASRASSEVFFELFEDPVLDYAVPSDDGWVFMTMDGMVYEAQVDGDEVSISEGWSINPTDTDATDRNGMPLSDDDDWRLGGSQAYAYSSDAEVLAVIMHQGGGQETFEDPGTEVWVFSTVSQRRGYRLAMEDGRMVSSVQITQDEDPVMLLSVGGEIEVREPVTGRLIRTIDNLSGTIQNLYTD